MNIEIKNLCKSYFLNDQEIEVLKNLNLSICAGDMISLTGPSGVGKSTFLHVLGTLDTPTSGEIIYEGMDIKTLHDAEIAAFRNQNIGYVFQFHHLLSEFSAVENVMMPLLMRTTNKIEARVKAKELLSFVGLSHRVEHKPGELSGGEQQRVALARALAHQPKILLADEPTGNLDEKTGQEIVELIFEHNQKFGTTVVLVTHNQRISEKMPRRLTLDKEGLKLA